MSIDAIDSTVLSALQKDARASWAELAESAGLTAPAVAERVRKLKEAGVIREFTAVLDPDALGASLLAFVAVTLEMPRHRAAFLHKVKKLSEVQECHHLAGDFDYLLKVRTAGTKELEHFLSNVLKGTTGVARTRTTIVLGTAKETAHLAVRK